MQIWLERVRYRDQDSDSSVFLQDTAPLELALEAPQYLQVGPYQLRIEVVSGLERVAAEPSAPEATALAKPPTDYFWLRKHDAPRSVPYSVRPTPTAARLPAHRSAPTYFWLNRGEETTGVA